MQQLTLTQMWDESFDDDISTLNSANESMSENGSIYPIDGGDEHFESSPSEHSSHSSQDTVPVVYDNSSVIDGISLESTQINVTTQLLTQDFHTSPNNEVAEDKVADDEVSEDLAKNEYHYFLQTHLGLYHDNLAHQEQVESVSYTHLTLPTT